MIDCSVLTKLISRYDVITIFRHENPDCDACGSQFGLKKWIEDNYDGKMVFALGYGSCNQTEFPASDEVADEVIKDSLAVVLDTANPERVDDQRYSLADQVIKVDHHPNNTPYGDYILVNNDAAATCEILAHYFASEKDKIVSARAAEYLYEGLLTDTLCFRTNNTTPETLQAAAFLSGFGLDLNQINRNLFDQSYDDFMFATYLRNQLKTTDDRKVAYVILENDELKKWNRTGSDARRFIDEFKAIKEFKAWTVITASEGEEGLYDASLRSKKILVNKIANLYDGGGHNNAAGLKKISRDQVEELIYLMHRAVIESEK